MGRTKDMDVAVSKNALDFCRRICADHAKSFYWASWALPRAKREAAWVVYAFSRISDDLVDRSGSDAKENFSRWRLAVRLAFRSNRSEDPVLDAFVRVCRQHGIRFGLVRCMLDGLCSDLNRAPDDRYRSFSELEAYCYRVAAIPGLMMLRVLGCVDPRAEKPACHLGIAMQLTNILRDLKDDAADGKFYLPQNELEKFGYDAARLQRGVPDEAFGKLLAFQVLRARRYYRSAEKGLVFLPADSRLCVRLCSTFYGHILSELTRPGVSPLTRRAVVPFWKKTMLAAKMLVFDLMPVGVV